MKEGQNQPASRAAPATDWPSGCAIHLNEIEVARRREIEALKRESGRESVPDAVVMVI